MEALPQFFSLLETWEFNRATSVAERLSYRRVSLALQHLANCEHLYFSMRESSLERQIDATAIELETCLTPLPNALPHSQPTQLDQATPLSIFLVQLITCRFSPGLQMPPSAASAPPEDCTNLSPNHVAALKVQVAPLVQMLRQAYVACSASVMPKLFLTTQPSLIMCEPGSPQDCVRLLRVRKAMLRVYSSMQTPSISDEGYTSRLADHVGELRELAAQLTAPHLRSIRATTLLELGAVQQMLQVQVCAADSEGQGVGEVIVGDASQAAMGVDRAAEQGDSAFGHPSSTAAQCTLCTSQALLPVCRLRETLLAIAVGHAELSRLNTPESDAARERALAVATSASSIASGFGSRLGTQLAAKASPEPLLFRSLRALFGALMAKAALYFNRLLTAPAPMAEFMGPLIPTGSNLTALSASSFAPPADHSHFIGTFVRRSGALFAALLLQTDGLHVRKSAAGAAFTCCPEEVGWSDRSSLRPAPDGGESDPWPVLFIHPHDGPLLQLWPCIRHSLHERQTNLEASAFVGEVGGDSTFWLCPCDPRVILVLAFPGRKKTSDRGVVEFLRAVVTEVRGSHIVLSSFRRTGLAPR